MISLWFVLALMTAGAAFAVLWPLGRARPARQADEVAVYRDQLDEVARDRATGLIGEREAEAARVEISRRLIAHVDAAETGISPRPVARLRARRILALGTLVVLPVFAGAVYLGLGSPQLPGQPLASRIGLPGQPSSIDGLVAQVEARLAQDPADGRAWEVLAPVYLRLGRVDDAVRAYRNAIARLGENGTRLAALGEALSMAANGVVTAEAGAAFARAVVLDPESVRARYFLGLAAEQDGRKDEAAARWQALLDLPQARADPAPPWVAFVREALARVSPAKGPTQEDVAAAGRLDEAERSAMVRGMVESLAARLKSDGGDAEAWLRLVRSYIVLGERENARGALADARRALAGDADGTRRLDDGLKGMDLRE